MDVIELRDRLESTLAIAQDNLSRMSRKYNRHRLNCDDCLGGVWGLY